eukprot:COSAG05_NODE_4150_length_1651_cov_11.625000_1_plen_102_part_00
MEARWGDPHGGMDGSKAGRRGATVAVGCWGEPLPGDWVHARDVRPPVVGVSVRRLRVPPQILRFDLVETRVLQARAAADPGGTCGSQIGGDDPSILRHPIG